MTSSPVLAKQYVEQRSNGYWISDTRISLDSVIYCFLNGLSPEAIAQEFPLLNLEQIYGGIAFYLANKTLIDQYLMEREQDFVRLQQSVRENNTLLYQKLKAAKDNHLAQK